jgi:hypothetical protein
MVTSSKLGAHVPFEIVQRKTFAPTESPETELVAELVEPKVAVPEMTVHCPVPIDGELAESVAVVEQMVWSSPAAAVVGFASTVIATSSNASAQVPPDIVHRKTLMPVPSAVIAVFASNGSAIVPVPEVKVQKPFGSAVAFKVVDVAQIV